MSSLCRGCVARVHTLLPTSLTEPPTLQYDVILRKSDETTQLSAIVTCEDYSAVAAEGPGLCFGRARVRLTDFEVKPKRK